MHYIATFNLIKLIIIIFLFLFDLYNYIVLRCLLIQFYIEMLMLLRKKLYKIFTVLSYLSYTEHRNDFYDKYHYRTAKISRISTRKRSRTHE